MNQGSAQDFRNSVERSSLIQRVSSHNRDRSSLEAGNANASTSKEYELVNTPLAKTTQLRQGEIPNLYSKDYFGLLINYASVGLVYGMFPSLVFPFLRMYLRMEGPQVSAARSLMTMPWSLKTFIGIVTDSFPIYGYRRRPYMVFGWLFCTVMLIIMACLPVPDPYYVPGTKEVGNIKAPSSGLIYVVLSFLAAVGYVIADVAADGVVVEVAQLEPEEIRGTTQTTIYFTRTLVGILSSLTVGITMNGKEYGGDFDFYVPFNYLMIVLAFFALMSVPASIWLLKEEKVVRESFTLRCREMWKIAQKRAIWQILLFNFFNSVYFDCSPPADDVVASEWAKIQTFNLSLFGVVGNVLMCTALWLTKKYFLQSNWRTMITITTVALVGIEMFPAYFTIFNVIRNQWFWLGAPIVEYIPFGIRFIVSTYVSVEIADEGYEAATYGLITTVHNLAGPFSRAMINAIDGPLNLTEARITEDTIEIRNDVASSYAISYSLKLLSLVFLLLLPQQKLQAQQLKATGGSSKWAATLIFGFMMFALIWSMSANFLSVSTATKCMRLAGGPGCK